MDIHSPRQLLAALPHILGFTPSACTVVVVLDGARIELTLLGSDAGDIDIDTAASAMRRLEAPCYVAITIDPRTADLAVLEPVTHGLRDYLLLDALCVVHGAWRSLLCGDDACCPPEGRPAADVVSAELVAAGSAPYASQAHLLAALAPLTLSDQQRAARAAALVHSAAATARDHFTQVLATLVTGQVDDWPARMQVCTGLGDYRVRDGVLRHLYAEPGDRLAVRGSLLGLVAYSPPDLVAAVATTLAGCAWLDGNMVLADLAVRHALDADPGYSLARLLDRALAHGVPPRVWADSLAAVTIDECVAGAA